MIDPKLFRYAEEYAPEPTRTYRVRGEETWREARAEYAAGTPAEQVCERHDLGLSAFRKRAKAEGWRRGDLPVPPPEPEPDVLPPPPPLPELVAQAMARLAWCLARGRLAEASACARLHKYLRALAAEEARGAEFAAFLADRRGGGAGDADKARRPETRPQDPPVRAAPSRAAPAASAVRPGPEVAGLLQTASGGGNESDGASAVAPEVHPFHPLSEESRSEPAPHGEPAETPAAAGAEAPQSGPRSPVPDCAGAAGEAEFHAFHPESGASAAPPPPPWRDWAHVEETARRRRSHGVSTRGLPSRDAPAPAPA